MTSTFHVLSRNCFPAILQWTLWAYKFHKLCSKDRLIISYEVELPDFSNEKREVIILKFSE